MCHALSMGIDFEDAEVREMAREVAEMTGETETGAVREALREKRERLEPTPKKRRRPAESMHEWMEREIWSQIPDHLLDREPMTKAEVEEILGIGPEGY